MCKFPLTAEFLERLLLENHNLKEEAIKRKRWLSKAKHDAGFDDNISFDIVWKKALEALKNSEK